MSAHRLIERAPTVAEYQRLRREVGWVEVEPGAVATGLQNAMYSVCAEDASGEIVGCARVVGDGGIYLYVQDLIVRPPFQGRGIGAELMEAVMTFVRSRARRNSFIGLMAAEGVVGFYERYGFEVRPFGRPGMYMTWSG